MNVLRRIGPRWLVLAAALVLVAVVTGIDLRPATGGTPRPARHRVQFQLSEWPASGTAGWNDDSGSFTVPLGTFSIDAPVTEAWVTVDTAGVSCTLSVDDVPVDTATAGAGKPGTCRWRSAAP